MIIIIIIITFFSTVAGGLFAVQFRDRANLIPALSAGTVIGVSFFDLLPESFALAHQQYGFSAIASVAALGFLVYMIFDRLTLLHSARNKPASGRGALGAGSLSVHSFLDGIGIGLLFQVSVTLGTAVAMAVVVHGFSDGMNTVSIIRKNKGEKRRAFKWLLIDSFAPVAGIVSTFFYSFPTSDLGLIFALFTGFFFYLGATDLLPETQLARSPRATIMTIMGAVLIFGVIRFSIS